MASPDRYRRIMTLYQPTSREAWDSVQSALPAIDATILGVIRSHGGTTCDAIEEQTGMKHQTVSAQVRHMVEGGILQNSGRKAFVRSGRRGIVWDVFRAGQLNFGFGGAS